MTEQPSKTFDIDLSDLDRSCRTPAEAFSKYAMRPEVNAATTFYLFSGQCISQSSLDVPAMISQLSAQAQATQGGDMKPAEALLVSQAVALDGIFNALAQRAALNVEESLGRAEALLRLALKAQTQCRATLQTLAEIKNPPTIFAKQANVGHNVQVNNGAMTPARAYEVNPQTMQNKVLEVSNGERLDTRAPGQAGRTHQEVGALEELNRPAKRRRKGEGRA
ncbi:hypothetical protein [Cupriavidus sp. IK-TO18]|uniref:hypothetical protein n=1 Tax=Cupriavidus sp. IK-TO18 TaxID=2782182 RepID=UPI001896BACB|nr:hypothetical protein [Cupriavidus sp. IK-TO18]MBF6990935.1 hypothetical protein [Cupriavidus sp. IK-TO18]